MKTTISTPMTAMQTLTQKLARLLLLGGFMMASLNAAAQMSQTIGGTAPASPITYSPGATFTLMLTGGGSGNPVVVTTPTPSVCSVSGLVVSVLTAGTCTLNANQAGNASYSAAPQVTATVVINKAAQYVNADFPAPFDYSPGGSFTLTTTGGASGNPVVVATTTPTVCSVGGAGGNVVSVLTAGTCTITLNQAGNVSYDPGTLAYNVVIYKLYQFIVLSGAAPDTPIVYSPGATFALNFTGGASGNPIVFTTNTPTVCSIAGNIVSVLTAGTCRYFANQAGNVSYNAAAQVTSTVTITKASQTITFGTLTNQPLNTAPFTVSATASSGLTVTFSSTTASTCSVAGSTVTLIATGTCTVRASQAGNVSYSAAANVNRSFTITAATTPPPGQVHYIHPDHLGTPRVITRASDNQKVWEWKNGEPFGDSAPNENPASLGSFKFNLRFPGQVADSETNTNYNYFRDYDPATGRYVQSDPVGLWGGLSTFSYVDGSPLSFTDFYGLAECIKQLMLVTAYNDIGPGKDWKFYKPKKKGDKPGSVGPGTIAVANAKPQPYPFGCKMKVLDDKGKNEYEGEVRDTGAGWNKKFRNVAPGDWIDIWLPGKDANKWGKQWRVVEICCDECEEPAKK